MLSTVILPFGFLVVLLSTPFLVPVLWTQTDTAANYAKFFLNYRHYLAVVEARSATAPQFEVWASTYGYDEWGVLYDETDEVASGHPSEGWKMKAKEFGVICCRYRHIIGHFYFVGVEIS